MRRRTRVLVVVVLAVSTVTLGGGRPSTRAGSDAAASGRTFSLPRGSEPVRLDPAQFTSRIDNPYWPMRPGSRWVFRETDGDGDAEIVEITVTRRTERILGIAARVVRDVIIQNGRVKEASTHWYAQDRHGNIWDLGEAAREYQDGGLASTEGSWQAGVDGAQPGILLPADPGPGTAYRLGHRQGEEEDAAEVLSVGLRARLPSGSFDQVLVTKESTPLEPNLLEHKFYARGVGPVLALTLSGGSDREELLHFELPR